LHKEVNQLKTFCSRARQVISFSWEGAYDAITTESRLPKLHSFFATTTYFQNGKSRNNFEWKERWAHHMIHSSLVFFFSCSSWRLHLSYYYLPCIADHWFPQITRKSALTVNLRPIWMITSNHLVKLATSPAILPGACCQDD